MGSVAIILFLITVIVIIGFALLIKTTEKNSYIELLEYNIKDKNGTNNKLEKELREEKAKSEWYEVCLKERECQLEEYRKMYKEVVKHFGSK